MKELYYYFRDIQKAPRITICLFYDEKERKVLARGIALCSMKETPNKRVGRALAFDRAVFALDSNTNSEKIGKLKRRLSTISNIERTAKVPPSLSVICSSIQSTDQFLKEPDCFFKSCINPSITRFEDHLLSKLAERNK